MLLFNVWCRLRLIQLFKCALQLATRLLEPDVVLMVDAGEELGYRRGQGMRFRPTWGTHPPFIIHPIDPTCNVTRVRVHTGWWGQGVRRQGCQMANGVVRG